MKKQILSQSNVATGMCVSGNNDNQYNLEILKQIYAPQIRGVPPSNANCSMMAMPNGEIRHYGFKGTVYSKKSNTKLLMIYASSCDYGLTWKECPVNTASPGACVQSPWSGHWLALLGKLGITANEWQSILNTPECFANGSYLCRSETGPEGPFKVTQSGFPIGGKYEFMRLPMPLKSAQRWLVPCTILNTEMPSQQPGVLLSDDDGYSWREVRLPSPPSHQVKWPHQGVRWQNYGCEPSVAELSDGRLWMLIRTSLDNHYEAFSCDGGDTWSEPAPSRFYATLTMPLVFTMSDQRLLCVWNNSTPLPELNHAKQLELNQKERDGVTEDVFTNRDVIHAAVSYDDGKSWRGFRELYLDEHRNDNDFRTSDGNPQSLDKSIHQAQAIQLPFGKILLSFGQHHLCRKFLIFDPDWLLETEREDDFSRGLTNWSIQQYMKSVTGNFRGISGHCSYNRRPGASLVPHPDNRHREALQVARHPDNRLLYEKEGAVWNFPLSLKGQIKLRLCMPRNSQGVRFCLLDRWFNPVDPVIHHFSQYTLTLDPTGKVNEKAQLNFDAWTELFVQWNLAANNENTARFTLDGGLSYHPLQLGFPTVNGLSYLHIQSLAEETDSQGVLIESVSMRIENDVQV